MPNITMYKTLSDYPNQTGFNQIAYPLRDSILIMNPFFAVLFILLIILTVSSYYAFTAFSGRTRFFNSLLASSFATFTVSVFFSLAGLVTPFHTLTFIGITVLTYIITVFYK